MIVAGFGFRGAASALSLRDAFDKARSGQVIDRLATAADKAEAAALEALAHDIGLPITGIPKQTLTTQPTLTQAPKVQAERGTGSVAEAAALAAAGPGARLLAPRVISSDRMASCALAISSEGQTP